MADLFSGIVATHRPVPRRLTSGVGCFFPPFPEFNHEITPPYIPSLAPQKTRIGCPSYSRNEIAS